VAAGLPTGRRALGVLLDEGIPARTVLWLGELRQYTSGEDGSAVLGRLARLLEDQDRVIAVTTVWPQHWNTYTAWNSYSYGQGKVLGGPLSQGGG
jgi:hypothetical protein